MNPLEHDLNHILDHTRDRWYDLRGERIFITGGTGFFGCWLLESLLWANSRLDLKAKAYVLTRTPKKFIEQYPHLGLSEDVHLIEGEIRSFAFPEGSFSHVIHAASECSAELMQRNPLRLLDSSVNGTRRCPEFVQCTRKPSRLYLYQANLAIWPWAMLSREQKISPCNIDSREWLSINDISIETRGRPNPEKTRRNYISDAFCARTELDLTTLRPRRWRIQSTIEFYHAH